MVSVDGMDFAKKLSASGLAWRFGGIHNSNFQKDPTSRRNSLMADAEQTKAARPCELTGDTILVRMHTPGGSARIKIEGGRFTRIKSFVPSQMPACRIVKMTKREIHFADMSDDGPGNGHLALNVEVRTAPLSSGSITGYTKGAATMQVDNGGCRRRVERDTPGGVTLIQWFG